MACFFKATDSLGAIYNGHELSIDDGVSPQILFAHFAMIVFEGLISFISYYAGSAIRIIVAKGTTTITIDIANRILPFEHRGTPGSNSHAGQNRSQTNTTKSTKTPCDGIDDNLLESDTLVNEDVRGDSDDCSAVDEHLYPAVDVPCEIDGRIYGSK